jgi:ABC-type transporter Mla subunit MlaD
MENLNDAAERVNRLLADVEEPVRAMMPQLTRTIRTADEITQRLEGPVKASAPNIERLVTTLTSPGFATLPNQLGDFINTIGDVSKRLAPLVHFAENAGGLFGGFKLPGMSAAPKPPVAPPAEEPPAKAPAETTAAKNTPAKKTPAKKTPAEKSTAKKTPARKSTARKSPAKKTPAKRR